MPGPTRQNYNIVRGDDQSIPVVFTLASGTIIGSKIWMTIKSEQDDPDPGLLQVDTVVGGVTIDDGTNATVVLTGEQTAELPVGSLHYDVQIRLPSGKRYTTQLGSLVVEADVTLATA